MSTSDVQHCIITPECRAGRGNDGAFDEAVRRLRREYDGVVAGWAKADQQPTLHLILSIERPRRGDRQMELLEEDEG